MTKRVIVGFILAAYFAAVVMLGGWFQLIAFTIVALFAVIEVGGVFKRKVRTLFMLPSYIMAVSYYFVFKELGLLPVVALWTIAVLSVLTERVLNKNRTTEETLYSLAVLLYPFSFFLVFMYMAELSFETSRIALICAFAPPLMGDILALFAGMAFGKKKLAPHISPKKTVAGSIAGVFGGVLGGYLTYLLQAAFPANIPLLPLLLLGLFGGVFGQIGDLYASTLKRWADIKDYGSIFPGHGGVVDRLDSVFFNAPIVLMVFLSLGYK